MALLYLFFNIIGISGLSYALWRRQKQQVPGWLIKLFWPALGFKLVCGLLVGLLYRYFFSDGDTFGFQVQSEFLTQYFYDSPRAYLQLWLTHKFESETVRTSMIYVWYSNSYFMVISLSLLNIITGGSYYLNALYFSLFSFCGCWALVATLTRIWPGTGVAAALAFLFFPSVVFWSAGILKEAVYLGTACWFLASILKLVYPDNRSFPGEWVRLVLAAWLLWKIRFYFAAVLFTLLGAYAGLQVLSRNYPGLQAPRHRAGLFAGLVLLLGWMVAQLQEVFYLDYFLKELIKSYRVILAASVGKPVVEYRYLEPDLLNVLAHAPLAALQAIIRPFLWEGDTFFYKLAGAENLVVMGLAVLALYQWARNGFPRPDLFRLMLGAYILVIAALIGLTTPNVGTMSRYRVAFLPFFLYLVGQQVYQFWFAEGRERKSPGL